MKLVLAISGLVVMSLAENIQDIMIKEHNIAREEHQVGQLIGDIDLTLRALLCAEKNAARGYLDHDCLQASGFGENLASGTDDISASGAFEMWYNEWENYDFNNPGFSMETGHFTQVVWKGSKKIGCAYAKLKCAVISCLYSPPGNFDDAFSDNVFPPSAWYIT